MSELKVETSEYEVVDIAKLTLEIEQLKLALATTNNTVAQLVSALKLKVDKDDITKQIISHERVISGIINADKINFK
ncbi:hypothetical protein LB941_01000 [Ligilactobacillus sp. WILCCON 0076]|uniref:Uncharacterized protein n=1 Tax=Ligilactobacillus ubinensis TaxID=2876789 RepID=A0A9X2FGL1_9LACO|nr:hypothetical protein [Ligilactobacillus ubinensis]MCP0885911.1 hypothetical protein [Ligilactobacillus ubinensis]